MQFKKACTFGVLVFVVLSYSSAPAQIIGQAWEFETDGDTQGWAPYSGVDSLFASNGTISTTLTDTRGLISGPEINLTSSEFGFIRIRLAANGATNAQVLWNTDTGKSGYISFSVEGDSAFHEYDIPVHTRSKWTDQITNLSRLITYGEIGTTIQIDYIRIISLGFKIELLYTKPFRSVFKVGQPIPLIAVVKSTGDRDAGQACCDISLPPEIRRHRAVLSDSLPCPVYLSPNTGPEELHHSKDPTYPDLCRLRYRRDCRDVRQKHPACRNRAVLS